MVPISQLIDQLTSITEANVAAAVALDVDQVSALAQRRADLLFEIKIRLQTDPEVDGGDRIVTRAATERLSRVEHRLDNAVGTVLRIFEPRPPGPSVYGRTGQLTPR